jgi:phosphatidate cytidylyltransferase
MAASNLTLRLATAGVMIPLLLGLLYAGPAWGWLMFLLAVAAVAAHELFAMTHKGDRVAQVVGVALSWSVMLALWFSPGRPRALLTILLLVPTASMILTLWRLGAMESAALRVAASSFAPLWLGGGIGAIALVRLKPDDGPSYVVLSLLLAWMADTGGYFAGRAFGKHPLYPKVSPKKTVEGAIGGVLAASLAAVAMHFLLLRSLPIRDAVVLGAAGSIGGIFGDLGVSVLKRSVGVKDTGQIFPGHGGMLDRIDAVLVTAPLTLIYILWFQNPGW